ncbi:MAG: helix-turn-helix transcriptional regulator [Chloroflexia bacterium]|nr:helix-turn-helix transcriptional regulator [Chloroflexia bacterium]
MKTIRQLREERGESENELAAAVGVTHADVVEWETGRAAPSIERLRRLTAHFGVHSRDIELDPKRAPSFTKRLADLL